MADRSRRWESLQWTDRRRPAPDPGDGAGDRVRHQRRRGPVRAAAEDELHPMQLSNHVVKAYGPLAPGQPAGWDYENESPLRDIRGYEISRSSAHPDQLTDSDLGMANMILTNGARLYVDHAHPEYSGPEVTSALDAVRWDKAGDAVAAIAARRASQSLGRSDPALQEQHRRQGRLLRHARELPAGPGHPVRPGRHPVHRLPRLPPGGDRGRPGRAGPGQPAVGVPAQPAGRLLRGGGGPGDDAQPPDHQHPRRTARRRHPAPPAARHHRRRQPLRDLDLPQGRHRLLGAAGDRGRRARRRPAARGARRGDARGQPRRRLPRPADAGGRPRASRRRPAGGLPRGLPPPPRTGGR